MSPMTKTPTELLKKAQELKYPRMVQFVVEDDAPGYFLAYLPDFGAAACSATGDSEEEAVAALEQVRATVIEHYIETGKPIPMPSPSPLEQQALQQMPIRLPRELHERLKSFARREGQSLNAFVVNALQQCTAMHSIVDTAAERIERHLKDREAALAADAAIAASIVSWGTFPLNVLFECNATFQAPTVATGSIYVLETPVPIVGASNDNPNEIDSEALHLRSWGGN